MGTTRFLQRRDSTTTILRKMGVNPRDYSAFIEEKGGGVVLNITAAEDHIKKLSELAKERKSKKSTPKPNRVSVSSRCRELIRAGKSDAEVWAIIKPEFSLSDAKKTYPAWYRSEIRRNESKGTK